MQALGRTADQIGYDAPLIKAVEAVNNRQKGVLFAKPARHFGGESQLAGKVIAVQEMGGAPQFPQSQTPVVQATGQRFSLNMISAVSTQGEFRFVLHEGSVGAKVFVEVLRRLMVDAEKPVFLIVGGHLIHKVKMVKRYAKGLDGKLKLFYLPPYSPHLNPDETVWAHVKRKVARQLVESAEEMKRSALGALRSIQTPLNS